MGISQNIDITKPYYGGKVSKEEIIKTKPEFLKKIKRIYGSKDRAVEDYYRIGWKELKARNYNKAIKYFNECWLLIENNFAVEWGFGSYLASQKKYKEAIELLKKAVKKIYNNPLLYYDIAIAHKYYSIELKKKGKLKESKLIVDESLKYTHMSFKYNKQYMRSLQYLLMHFQETNNVDSIKYYANRIYKLNPNAISQDLKKHIDN